MNWTINPPIEMVKESENITTPEQVREICKEFETLPQEAFICIDLNAKNKVISKRMVTLGTVNSSLVTPRETFRGAIINNASSVIIAHNHPSGCTDPSSEDIRITRKLIDAASIIGINILDHIILGSSSRPYSMRESGIVNFNA